MQKWQIWLNSDFLMHFMHCSHKVLIIFLALCKALWGNPCIDVCQNLRTLSRGAQLFTDHWLLGAVRLDEKGKISSLCKHCYNKSSQLNDKLTSAILQLAPDVGPFIELPSKQFTAETLGILVHWEWKHHWNYESPACCQHIYHGSLSQYNMCTLSVSATLVVLNQQCMLTQKPLTQCQK